MRNGVRSVSPIDQAVLVEADKGFGDSATAFVVHRKSLTRPIHRGR
jgi:hypothetical protein